MVTTTLPREWPLSIASQEQLFAGMTLEAAIDSLEAIFDRQIRSDPLWTVLRMEFWLVASRDPEVRRRLVAEAEPYRQRAGNVIDDLLAEAGQTTPFTGRELEPGNNDRRERRPNPRGVRHEGRRQAGGEIAQR